MDMDKQIDMILGLETGENRFPAWSLRKGQLRLGIVYNGAIHVSLVFLRGGCYEDFICSKKVCLRELKAIVKRFRRGEGVYCIH